MPGADDVAERTPWRVPERWSLVAVVTADVAEQSLFYRYSNIKYFEVVYSKELLERLFLVPWSVCVDDTQSDFRRNIPSRLIRGPDNPVKDGGPLATRISTGKIFHSWYFVHACSKVYHRYLRPCLSHRTFFILMACIQVRSIWVARIRVS